MSGKKGQKGGGLGRALMKNAPKPQRRKGYVDEWSQTQFPEEPKMLESIIDASDIQGIMDNVALQNDRFVAEKQNVVVLSTTSFVLSDKLSPEQIEAQRKHWNDLTIPKRLEENENLLLTPFEKNIEVWRQLWRVIERSDLIVQILDARDPLLFRSLDLESYIDSFKDRKSMPQKKIKLLLLNKADLLTPAQRKSWADYFKKAGLRFAFFSAYQEQLKLDEELRETKLAESLENDPEGDLPPAFPTTTGEIPNVPNFNQRKLGKKRRQQEQAEESEEDEEDSAEDSDGNEDEEVAETKEGEKTEAVEPEKKPTVADSAFEDFTKIEVSLHSERVLNREELFAYFHKLCREELAEQKESITVGMVGYPNVGKSSTVNVLYHRRKVAVSATPGKTKHFQTLKVNDALTLCDCPGLVFPTFMSTRAEMTASGLLRIDEMKDYLGPVSVVTRRVPRAVMNYTYNLTTKGPHYMQAGEFLKAYAHARGFYVTLHKPDEAKAARLVLKDFVNGKLLFCRAPPEVDQEEFNALTKHPTMPDYVPPQAKPKKSKEPKSTSESSTANEDETESEESSEEEEAEFDPTAPILDEDGDQIGAKGWSGGS